MPNYKKLAVETAKKIAKTENDYTCEKCFRSKPQVQIHGAHILPVTWAGTAADPENILSLCAACHSVGSNSQHQDPIPFSRWFENKFPGRYDQLRKRATDYSQNPLPKIDWEETYKKLKQELKELELSKL